MIRAIYRVLLWLHAPAFRRQFAAEMLWIFDESAESRFGPLPLGDVAAYPDEADDLARRVAQRHFGRDQPATGSAIPVYERLFAVENRLAGSKHLHVVAVISLSQLRRKKIEARLASKFRLRGPSGELNVG